jgi:dTDP-4-amino-4,6-dideoxygalactose transaminase
VSDGWRRVLERRNFILGEEVRVFEEAFAAFAGVRHCVGVGNGTDALDLALRASGVGRGDEVIVPTNSFVASALAVLRAGADPVLVDVDPDTLLIDPSCVAERIGPRTKAIMPVHLYGQMAPVEQLSGFGALIIEDAAQAHGASRNGAAAGGVGLAAGTSFYPGKNLGAYGDGGGVLTNDDEVARRVRALRNWGGEEKYMHPEQGFNSRLDTLQAVVLSAKLRRLAGWNEQRRAAASLRDTDGVVRPVVADGNVHVWHLYVVQVSNRDAVLTALRAAGVGAGIHYPIPIHLQGSFAELGLGPGTFPVAEEAAGRVLSLPLFAEITETQQERVVDALRAAL